MVIQDLPTYRKGVLAEMLTERFVLQFVISTLASMKAQADHAGRWLYTCLGLGVDNSSCFCVKDNVGAYLLVIGAMVFRGWRSRLYTNDGCTSVVRDTHLETSTD